MLSNKRVGIWKNEWLPNSETFIRDQISDFRRWEAVTIGFRNIPGSLMAADCALFGDSKTDRYLRRVLGVQAKFKRYEEFVKFQNVDMIHAHFGSGGVNVLPLARSMSIPLVTTFHGADTSFYGSKLPGVEWSYRHSLKKVFSYSARLIVASSYLADRLILAGAPASKIEVLYTGTKVRDLVSNTTKRGVMFAGRLIDIKGCADLIEAYAMIPRNVTANSPLTIVGEGPQREFLEMLAIKRGLNARFVGRLDSDEVAVEMSKHAVFCGPSKVSDRGTREGLGMVFLEAAVQECAVVGYASGGVAEAVSHGVTGFLATEGNIEELSKFLRLLLENSNLSSEMGHRGRERVAQQFDLTVQTSKLEALYDSCFDLG